MIIVESLNNCVGINPLLVEPKIVPVKIGGKRKNHQNGGDEMRYGI